MDRLNRDAQLAEARRSVEEKRVKLLAAERPGILAAIQKFSDAFQHRSQKELQAIWLKPDAEWLAAIGVKNATFQVALKSCLDHEMELDGEKAAIRCSLITSTTVNFKLQEPTVSKVTVALRKVEGKWWILDPRH